MKKTLTFILAFASFTLPIGNSLANRSEGEIKKLTTTQIEIKGRISPQMAKDFARLVDPNITEVIVTSPGGNTEAGLDIAEIIQARKIDVTVKDYCISSCANYIFVAGNRKKVLNRSLLGWHGGHHTAFFDPKDTEVTLSKILELLKREQNLYLNAKTSLELIIYSGLVTSGASTEKAKPTLGPDGKYYLIGNAKFEYETWIPTLETLKKLGVSNIEEFWHPGSQSDAEKMVLEMKFGSMKIFVGDVHSHVPLHMARKRVVN